MNQSMKIGITDTGRTEICKDLQAVLTSTFTLYLKTHDYHWNVTGPLFSQLHTVFDQQYNALWAATDLIAERMRALGGHVEVSYDVFTKTSDVKLTAENISAKQMIKNLLDGHETLCRQLRGSIELAEKHEDTGTADFLTARLEEHEKTAWFLRASLEE